MRLGRTAVTVAALLFTQAAAAQSTGPRLRDTNANGWFMYFGDHPVSEKWGIHLEGQWRRYDVITRWQQLLLRPGVNYELNRSVMFTVGYGYINTWPYGDFPAADAFPEHRIFQQVLLKHKAGKVDLQHRYRLEQRFIGEVGRREDGSKQIESWRYQNRFRYMLRGSIPLRGPWYVGLYDEIFLHFAPNFGPNVFDQNRAYGALGYNFGRIGRLETGYMNQLLAQRNGRVLEVNHTLQLGFYSNLPFGR
ncbi:MAG: DUF2490 domain-containing protein [Bryobacteraceae bacterium]